jgi:replicative DNA helicase
MRAKARRLKAQQDVQLIIVDYLQLLRSTSRRAQDNRQLEISEISGGLKGLAKELKIPIIVVAQLNRQPELRAGRKPRLSDLRESGSIEQDADLVALLVRPELYEEDEEAHVEKARRSRINHREPAQRSRGRDSAHVPQRIHPLRNSRAQCERTRRGVLIVAAAITGGSTQ